MEILNVCDILHMLLVFTYKLLFTTYQAVEVLKF